VQREQFWSMKSGAVRVAAIVGMLLVQPPNLVAQVAGVSGTLVVTNKAPATATIVDVATGRTVATLPTGQGPHEIVITSDGRVAVVTDYGAQTPGSSLTVIDIVGARVARTITLGEYRRPHGIVMMPGDSVVAVTVEVNKQVLLVNVNSGRVEKAVATQQLGSHMVGVTADGRRAWTGDIGSNTVSELDLVTGVKLRSIAVPAQPEAINVTPDGSEVWVGSNATGTVSVVDVATGAVTPAATGFGWPYRVLFTPDASVVLLPDLRGEALRFVDRRTRRELHRIALAGTQPQGITLTPDAKYAFLSLSAQGRVAVFDVGARKQVGDIAVGDSPDGVVYSKLVVRQ
jgi:DNA-binding beta-propeller fold protein YncE